METKKKLQCWKDLIGEVEKEPWGLDFKIVTERMVTRRKTPGLDNADRVKYIVRSLFPHVEPLQRQYRSSCVVRPEELFTLEELKRTGGRLKASTAPGIDGVPNEILKEVIGAYPEILLEAFNSYLREGRFFVDWKKQRLVLLRKGKKPQEDASSYRPICLLDTIGKLLEEMILQRLQGHMVGELRISESLWRVKRWLGSRCLKMAPEKTETLLVTDRRSFKYPRIVLGEHEIDWKKSIKYNHAIQKKLFSAQRVVILRIVSA